MRMTSANLSRFLCPPRGCLFNTAHQLLNLEVCHVIPRQPRLPVASIFPGVINATIKHRTTNGLFNIGSQYCSMEEILARGRENLKNAFGQFDNEVAAGLCSQAESIHSTDHDVRNRSANLIISTLQSCQ